MRKLIEVAMIVFFGFLVIKFLRWVFAITPGSLKFWQWGIGVWGINIIEALVVIFLIASILGALLHKD